MLQHANPIIVTLHDAIQQGLTTDIPYDFDLLEEYADQLKVLIFETAVQTGERIDLHDLFLEKDIAGMIFRSDLQVDNTIFDFELDTYSCFLQIAGNLRCHNLVAGCAIIHVGGNVNVTDTLLGFYNHGEITIGGDLHAKLWIEDDHQTLVQGAVHAVTFMPDEPIATPHYTDWHDILLPEAATTLLDKEYLFGGDVRLIQMILDGQPVFRGDL